MKVIASCVILIIITFVSSANCWGKADKYPQTVVEGEECRSGLLEVCDADGKGFKRYDCEILGPWKWQMIDGRWRMVRENGEIAKKVWSFYDTSWAPSKVRCPPEESMCRCEENPWYEQDCECVNPRKFPDWPDIGILSWNGTSYYDDNWWVGYENPRTSILPVTEIHRNGNGHYMKKWSKVAWPEKGDAIITSEFEIIVPDVIGKNFTKYTGKSGNKTCKVKKTSEGGKPFVSITTLPWYVYPLTLKHETKKEGSVTSQVWKTKERGDDWDRYWRWTLDYDSQTNTAVPTSSYHGTDNGFVGTQDKLNRIYSFERLDKGAQSFRVEDYCSFQ